MVQVPTPTIVAILPETVQTLVVADVNVTARPESAVAFSASERVAKVMSLIAAKVMICVRTRFTVDEATDRSLVAAALFATTWKV